MAPGDGYGRLRGTLIALVVAYSTGVFLPPEKVFRMTSG
jgi:hypothetical protein